MVETADSAKLAHGDEMNVVQIRYGLVVPNTACQSYELEDFLVFDIF